MHCLVEAVDGPDTGIDVGKFSDPLVACFRLEDSTKHVHSLLTFSWTVRRMERQEFEMPDTCAEGMPELWLKGGQSDILTVLRLVDIVAREATIETGASWLWNFIRVQISRGEERQQRGHPLGHRDIDIATIVRFSSSH